MHVGEFVVLLVEWQRHHILDLGFDHQHGTGRSAHLYGVHHDQDVDGVGEELLDEVNAADPDFDEAHLGRQPLGGEMIEHRHPEPVVAPEHVSHPGHQHVHALTLSTMGDTPVGRLTRALERFPRRRYPVKHAGLQRQLAHELAMSGSLVSAERALMAALDVYGDRFPIERGFTLNALGAVLRDQGRAGEALAVLDDAIALLEGSPHRAELGGVLFNRGLVQSQLGDGGAATESFTRASSYLDEKTHPRELSATLRESARVHLMADDPEQAVMLAERSIELAAAGGDRYGLGASNNLLGLARLAIGDESGALDSFAESAAAHPVTVRPEGHAMAKANSALAYEALGESDRARQAAHQALSLKEAPPEVVRQAESLLDRLGRDYDIHSILDRSAAQAWQGILRDETRHWGRWESSLRQRQLMRWVEGVLARSDTAVERCEALFQSMLELEPVEFESVAGELRAALSAFSDEDASRFRSLSSRAAARFRVPQMERLESALGSAG